MPRTRKVYCEPFAGRGNVFFCVRGHGFKFDRWILNDPTTNVFFKALLDISLRDQIPRILTKELATALNRKAREDRDPLAMLMSVRTGYSGSIIGRCSDATFRSWNRNGGSGRKRFITAIRNARRVLTWDPPAELWDDDGLDVIDKARSGWFLYVDPPYLGCSEGLYDRVDGQDEWHADMINRLHHASKRNVKWMLSGYDTPLYRKKIGSPSWSFNDYRYSARSNAEGKCDRVMECVWQNYDE
jgi:site-specific DNA-adenine methylase